MRNSLLAPISQRSGCFLLSGPELKNTVSYILTGLLDFLHLLANTGSGGLIATFGLADITLNFSYQCLKSFIFLHIIVLHSRKETHCYLGFKQPRNLKADNSFVKEKWDFCKKTTFIFSVQQIACSV
jgi:hypothetical protein